jgi:hypothetical protein
MARTLDKPRAIAEGLSEWQEQAAEAYAAYNADCACCCCTGECNFSADELTKIEQQVFFGELDRWPF